MAAIDVLTQSSLKEYIDAGKALDISHEKLHVKSGFTYENTNKVIIINFSSILDRYQEYLNAYRSTVTLTELEYQKYRYNPKLLSYDLYGTTELWSTILRINNIVSISDFDKKTIDIYSRDVLKAINEIITLETDTINQSKSLIQQAKTL